LSLLSLAVSWLSCVSKLPERRKQKTNCFRRWRMKCRKSRRTETSYLFFPFGFGSLLSFYFIAISNLPDVANGTGWSSPSAATDRRDETILWRSRDRRLVSLSFACLLIFSFNEWFVPSCRPLPAKAKTKWKQRKDREKQEPIEDRVKRFLFLFFVFSFFHFIASLSSWRIFL
jgi:hypothetical protein